MLFMMNENGYVAEIILFLICVIMILVAAMFYNNRVHIDCITSGICFQYVLGGIGI
jgi:hypothetical protein